MIKNDVSSDQLANTSSGQLDICLTPATYAQHGSR